MCCAHGAFGVAAKLLRNALSDRFQSNVGVVRTLVLGGHPQPLPERSGRLRRDLRHRDRYLRVLRRRHRNVLVEIKVLFGADLGHVRAVEPDAEEEGLASGPQGR